MVIDVESNPDPAVPMMGMSRPPSDAACKVGALDDPKAYGNPNMAIYAVDKQSFHHIRRASRYSSGGRGPRYTARPNARWPWIRQGQSEQACQQTYHASLQLNGAARFIYRFTFAPRLRATCASIQA